MRRSVAIRLVMPVLMSVACSLASPTPIPGTPDAAATPSSAVGAVGRTRDVVELGHTLDTLQPLADKVQQLYGNDVLKLHDGGEALLSFLNGLKLTLFNDSTLGVIQAAPGQDSTLEQRIYLFLGGFTGELTAGPGHSAVFEAPGGAAITVLGTEFLVVYDPASQITTVGNFGGSVTVTGGGRSISLASGNLVDVPFGGMPGSPHALPFTRVDFDRQASTLQSPLLAVQVLLATATPTPSQTHTPPATTTNTPMATRTPSPARTQTPTSTPSLTPTPAPLLWYVSPQGKDGNDCQSAVTSCQTIQAAINRATSGDTVVVAEGNYYENVAMRSGVNVIGAGPATTAIVGVASVSGVVRFLDVQNAELQGFKLTVATPQQGIDRAVVFEGNTDATASLRNTVIADTQYGIDVWSPAAPTIENNTLVGVADEQGIYIGNNATAPTIRNNIITGYGLAGIHVVAGTASPPPMILYNDVWNNKTNYLNYPDPTGIQGNISVDPLFVDDAVGDYHLLSCSPAIDAGDPTSDYANEPKPNGNRIDLGAYGNTREATSFACIS